LQKISSEFNKTFCKDSKKNDTVKKIIEKKMKKKKIIRTPYGTNRVLAAEFGVKDSVISWALHGRAKSLRALKIRKRAVEILKELEITENDY